MLESINAKDELAGKLFLRLANLKHCCKEVASLR